MAKLRTLTQGLRAKAGVLVLLDAPRVDVDPGPGPVRGASDAPVTIVEFSDFQCPFCARTQATLTQLEEQYAGKVRLVFRHFPLPIHKDAPAAAEASECAREQNRFWEMHDAMFAIANITAADIPRAAERVKLDMTHFDSCVQSGRHRQAWERDKAAGERHGVASTPTFFVNGRMVVGAQPIETFAAVVNEELDRHRTQNR
jgi:protein-disulfide isomerase